MNKYLRKEEIDRLNISDSIKNYAINNLNKKITYSHNGSCVFGILVGILEKIKQDNSIFYYILETNNKYKYIPTWTQGI